MSVNPGFGGQKFIKNTYSKIRQLKEMVNKKNKNVLIEIDGGVNEKTIKEIADSGVDVFVAGSAIFGSKDYEKTILNFREKISG
jgi:ribulose-phosphate 3-epimerase